MPFQPAPVQHSPAVDFLLTDSYFHLLQLLVEHNIVKNVFIVSKSRETSYLFAGFGIYRYSDRITIVYAPNLQAAQGYIGDITAHDVIWTRGTADIWSKFLSRNQHARKVLYNLAYLRATPDLYDLIFADEDCQFKELKKHPHVYSFCKSCNETIFYPLNNTQKVYDIISIGTIRERKGQYRLIKILKSMKCPFKVVFPGIIRDREYMDSCLSLAKDSPLDITFPGMVSREKLNVLINQSKLHVLLSRYEQAPRALLEVACAGVLSLVSNRIGGGKNYITEGMGIVSSMWRLKSNMIKMLHTWKRPVREEYLKQFSSRIAIEKIKSAFKDIGWI